MLAAGCASAYTLDSGVGEFASWSSIGDPVTSEIERELR